MIKKVLYDYSGPDESKQRIRIDELVVDIYGAARRIEPDKFKTKHHCDLCDPLQIKYVPKVIQIPGTPLKACTYCIYRMYEALRAATLADCAKGRIENET